MTPPKTSKSFKVENTLSTRVAHSQRNGGLLRYAALVSARPPDDAAASCSLAQKEAALRQDELGTVASRQNCWRDAQ